MTANNNQSTKQSPWDSAMAQIIAKHSPWDSAMAQIIAKHSPWDSAMAQIIAQQAMTGNNNFLIGMILSGLLKNGWESQKKDWETAQDNPDVKPINNMYGNIRNWFEGITGKRKNNSEMQGGFNVPTYQSEIGQVLDKYPMLTTPNTSYNDVPSSQIDWNNIPSILNARQNTAWANQGIGSDEMREIDEYKRRMGW